MTTRISLEEARRFLIRHNKARAIALGTWPQIAAEWNRAFAAVEADKTAFLALPKPVERSQSDVIKERTRACMRVVARERKTTNIEQPTSNTGHRTPNTGDRKRCIDCEVEKERSEFYAARRMLDGLEKRCKECKRAIRRRHWRRTQ